MSIFIFSRCGVTNVVTVCGQDHSGGEKYERFVCDGLKMHRI